MEDVKDRVRGVIMGLAAGDRIGGPVRMAIRLAESLATQQRFDLDHIAHCYLHWWDRGAFDTGPVAASVFQLVASGMSFDEAVSRVDRERKGLTAGCNPAHRSSPLAMASFLKDEELSSVAIQEASLTHKHALAGDVAAAIVILCRVLIRGVEFSAGLQEATERRASQTSQALQIGLVSSLINSGFSPDVLHAAVYFVDKSMNFDEALKKAIKFAGMTNYCPVLVGAIGGARWGESAIPHNALNHCTILPRVQNVANVLSEQWNDK